MEGLFFYWISWMVWVCMMFFVPKQASYRFSLLFHLLVVMVLSRYIVTIYSFSIQLSGLYMFWIICTMIRKHSMLQIFGVITNSYLIAMAYASFHLFVLLDPIWVMIKPTYLQCLFMNYLVILLVKDGKMRVLVLLFGMIIGDFVYGGVLTFQGLTYVSLSYSWHDAMVMVLLVQLLWSSLEVISKWLYRQSQGRMVWKDSQEYR